MRIRPWIIACCLMWPVAAQAQSARKAESVSFGYHPDAKLALGAGFDANAPTELKIACATGPSRSEDGGGGPGGFNLKSDVAFSAEELRRALEIDVHVDASYLSFSGSADFNQRYERQMTSHSVAVYLFATAAHPAMVIDVLTPTEPGKSAVKLSREKFYERCGTHIVRRVERATRLGVVLFVSGMTNEEKSSISASLKAEMKLGAGGGSASARFSESVAKAQQEGRVTIEVFGVGGDGYSETGGIIAAMLANYDTSKTDKTQSLLAQIGQELQKVITAQKSATAAAVRFDAVPMSFVFDGIDEPSLLDEIRYLRLADIVAEFARARAAYDATRRTLDGKDPRATAPLSDVRRKELVRLQTDLEVRLTALAEVHRTCREPGAKSMCNMPESTVDLARAPVLPAPPRAKWVVSHEQGTLNEELSSIVLETGISKMLGQVQILEPRARQPTVLLRVTGTLLTSAQLVIESQSGVGRRAVMLMPITDGGGSFRIVGQGGDQPYWSAISRECTSTPAGRLLLRIIDEFGRATFLELGHCESGADGFRPSVW